MVGQPQRFIVLMTHKPTELWAMTITLWWNFLLSSYLARTPLPFLPTEWKRQDQDSRRSGLIGRGLCDERFKQMSPVPKSAKAERSPVNCLPTPPRCFFFSCVTRGAFQTRIHLSHLHEIWRKWCTIFLSLQTTVQLSRQTQSRTWRYNQNKGGMSAVSWAEAFVVGTLGFLSNANAGCRERSAKILWRSFVVARSFLLFLLHFSPWPLLTVALHNLLTFWSDSVPLGRMIHPDKPLNEDDIWP